jgi:hypothetical protein
MRAYGRKYEMGRRFAILIGVAAVGAMALGAQTVLAGGDRAPDLKFYGPHSFGGNPEHGGPGPRAVWVGASCGSFIGPPASPAESDHPPANLPDLGCHLSAKGKVTKVKNDTLKRGLQSRGVDLPGPHVQCYSQRSVTIPPVLTCRWESGSRAAMWLRLGKRTFKQVRSALDDGEKVLAKVTVRAKYASGKVETATRTVRLVKYAK